MKQSPLRQLIQREIKLALKEAVNQASPELDKVVKRCIDVLVRSFGYKDTDAVMGIVQSLRRQGYTQFINEASSKGWKPSTIRKLREWTEARFDPMVPGTGKSGPALDLAAFAKIMPKTAKTVKEATDRIMTYEGGQMFVHAQSFEVQPNGNAPDRPTYRLGQNQYWLRDRRVNVTSLTLTDITGGKSQFGGALDKNALFGTVFVDTDVFLDEVRVVFTVLKRQS